MRVLNDKDIRLAIAIGEDVEKYVGVVTDGDREIAETQYKQDIRDFMEWLELDLLYLKELIANRENERAVAFIIEKWASLKQLVEVTV